MSLDRVDDVTIVDKAREFRMSQQWQDQWLFFTGFITSLERRIIPAFDFHDNTVELSDSEQNLVIKLIKEDKYDNIASIIMKNITNSIDFFLLKNTSKQ